MLNIRKLVKLSKLILKISKQIFKFAIYVLIVFFIGVQFFNLGIRLFYERAVDTDNGKTIDFIINNGDDVKTIANNLYSVGLIDVTLVFRFRAYIYKIKFSPNVYSLKSTMTIKNMLDIFDDNDYIEITTTNNIKENDEEQYGLSPEEEDEE